MLADPDRGVDLRNVHPLIAELVHRPEGGSDAAMFHALKTTLSFDDALDLREISEWGDSWRAAIQRNADAIAKITRERDADHH